MCGICGFTGQPNHNLLRSITTSLIHRGPDDDGFYEDEDISMGSRRLRIIDLAGGRQPMRGEDGATWIVYNGEIYNYAELRQDLEKRGHSFTSNCDTESVVHAYEEFGLDFPLKLSGMFAIAIWDAKKRRLVLARDRIGMKPLYYVRIPDGIVFASEVKALLLHPQVQRKPNMDVLRLILSFGYEPDDRTSFQGISKVPPGHMLIWEGGTLTRKCYWRLPTPSAFQADADQVAERVGQLLIRAVRSHLTSDVPIGAFISGGLDSGVIAAIARKLVGDELRTFTFGYTGAMDEADSVNARAVAEFLGTVHKEIVVDESRLLELLPRIIYHHDAPQVDEASIPTIAAASAVKKYATVVLVGEGADEQFGGYVSNLYFRTIRRLKILSPGVLAQPTVVMLAKRAPLLHRYVRIVELAGCLRNQNRALRLMNSPLFSDAEIEAFAERAFLISGTNGHAAAVYDPLLQEVGSNDATAPCHVELRTYIPNNICARLDKMMMAASVEARLPFLDLPVLEFLPTVAAELKVRAGVTKYVLRRVANGMLPKPVTRRPKAAIRVPVKEWIGGLSDSIVEMATSRSARSRGILSENAIQQIVRHGRDGKDLYSARQLFCLLVLELWWRIFLEPDEWVAQPPNFKSIFT